jgi:hypothetical protein
MQPDAPAAAILRRVGTVLAIVGTADIGLMLYAIVSGWSYSSSFNIFAVVAGILLRRGSLRTARIVASSAAFMLAMLGGIVLALAFAFPADLIRTYLRTTALGSLLGFGIFVAAALVLLFWVHRSLATPEVRAALIASGLAPRFWHSPRFTMGVGAACALLFAVGMPWMNRSDTGRHAVDLARAERGDGYRYYVTQLSSSWSSDSTRVRASVVAYSDNAIETVRVEWRE